MLSPALAERQALLPAIPKRSFLPERLMPSGEPRGRVALFSGCIAAHLFGDVNEATARVLQRNGYEVVVPKAQTCCGALHLHNGLPETGRELARKNIEAFGDVEAIVVNAAGCGAALTEYGELLEGDALAKDFAARVVDVSAFLVREGFEAPKASASTRAKRVAYDAPCHLFHAQGVKSEPRELLSQIPGVELVDYPNSERCARGHLQRDALRHVDGRAREQDEGHRPRATGRHCDGESRMSHAAYGRRAPRGAPCGGGAPGGSFGSGLQRRGARLVPAARAWSGRSTLVGSANSRWQVRSVGWHAQSAPLLRPPKELV